MKINYLILVASFCVATIAKAQTDPEKKSYKNDIGFNTVFILQGVFNSNQTPFSLMYKKYTSENSAIRFGASINANWNKARVNDTLYSNTINNTTSFANVSLAIGKEFQRPINTKWIWYFGGDLVPSFWTNKNVNYQSGIKSYEYSYKSYGLSARPFLGIRFAINDRLYLSAEANVSLGYNRNSTKQRFFNPNQQEGNTTIDNFAFSMSPASGLFLYYRF